MQKTYMQKTADVKREWHLVDAKDQILGRLASDIAQKLIGKGKPTYTPHIDGGDHVVVINASEIAVTGNKEETKMYYRHSGFPGGLKEKSLGDLKKTYPTRIIEKAVFNMLPKNKLRSGRMTRLKVYAGAEHKHESQIKGQK
ncbi:MAG: 50S ribosomal protein L13 [Candidatus Pacebacteria bacterium]|nr:50S ribosomal protein L13 [Candidatus Paceibacterota bacterium]